MSTESGTTLVTRIVQGATALAGAAMLFVCLHPPFESSFKEDRWYPAKHWWIWISRQGNKSTFRVDTHRYVVEIAVAAAVFAALLAVMWRMRKSNR